jgi:hypothetical protein
VGEQQESDDYVNDARGKVATYIIMLQTARMEAAAQQAAHSSAPEAPSLAAAASGQPRQQQQQQQHGAQPHSWYSKLFTGSKSR